jgi:hypothetical protein
MANFQSGVYVCYKEIKEFHPVREGEFFNCKESQAEGLIRVGFTGLVLSKKTFFQHFMLPTEEHYIPGTNFLYNAYLWVADEETIIKKSVTEHKPGTKYALELKNIPDLVDLGKCYMYFGSDYDSDGFDSLYNQLYGYYSDANATWTILNETYVVQKIRKDNVNELLQALEKLENNHYIFFSENNGILVQDYIRLLQSLKNAKI